MTSHMHGKHWLGGLLALMTITSCSKKDKVTIINPVFASGEVIAPGDTLNGRQAGIRAIKGTLKAGETYYLSSEGGDAVVNAGDTLVVQPGVKVYIIGPTSGSAAIGTQDHEPAFIINGTLLSLGTKDQPILFSVQDASKRSDPAKDPQDPNEDPAFKGYWGGIQAGTHSGDVIIKWTRLEYLGGLTPTTDPNRAAKPRYGIWMQNPDANFVLEDSWLYGSFDDMVRISGGKYEVLRNSFEKVGFQAGEAVNVKSGSVGDIAYNLVVGCTGNAFKTSNAGGLAPQSSMITYNNTIINAGYRQAKAGEGGSIDFENDGRGLAYNNILVNCAYGLSVLGGSGATPAADTANIRYGYTLNYGDNVSITTQFLPSGFITAPQQGDINAGNATTPGANNPDFVNYPLPMPENFNFFSGDFVGRFNFHLKNNSPAAGKGFTNFAPSAVVMKDAVFGVTEVTAPGKDLGCFQMDGTGNQH